MNGPALYSLEIDDRAEKHIARLPESLRERVAEALLGLQSEPRPRGCKKLKGMGMYRIRVGDYRALYDIDDAARRIVIIDVLHRKDAYS